MIAEPGKPPKKEEEDLEEEPGFFQRFRVPVVLGVVLLLGAGMFLLFGKKAEPKRKASVSMVSLMPVLPPPPPPTPQPTPPPQEQPTPETKQPEFQAEEKPENAQMDEPKSETPEEVSPLGSNIQGDGADGFGLRGSGNGIVGGKGNGKGAGGTKWGWYAGQVQSRVVEALGKHRRTRSSTLSVKVRIWADSTGRITRATLDGTSGDPAVDKSIQSEILTGLQLQEPPPEDMPMPIVMRITAKRPN